MARYAYVAGELVSNDGLLFNLDSMYPELHLQLDDLEIIDGEWTIDGMEPLEWCRAMMME
jgi:hypothetical protein